VEDAGERGCLGHVPELPGLSLRAKDPDELKAQAAARVREYARWLCDERLADVARALAEGALRQVAEGSVAAEARIAEHVPGAPVWESGNAAVLFERDLRPLDEGSIVAHLRFVRRVLDRIRDAVEPLLPVGRGQRPAPGRRSIDETLDHVGNCVWWYCSRIDDDLPEPEEVPGEDPLDRIDRLFEIAEPFLLAVPPAERAWIHVPQRFRTKDPTERWTHTKVCRRQAEHVWEHLPGLRLAVESTSRT
jgi:hypothetical protein